VGAVAQGRSLLALVPLGGVQTAQSSSCAMEVSALEANKSRNPRVSPTTLLATYKIRGRY